MLKEILHFQSMEGLYHQTNSLLEQTQGYFIRLEQARAGEDTERLETEVRQRLETMWANTERLDMLAGKETAARRQVARQKIDQLKYDIQHLHSALQVNFYQQTKDKRQKVFRFKMIFSPWSARQQ